MVSANFAYFNAFIDYSIFASGRYDLDEWKKQRDEENKLLVHEHYCRLS